MNRIKSIRNLAGLVLFMLFLLTILLPENIQAQSNYQDVVYLKNGSVIRGMIIEQIPNQSLKIQTADGSLFVYTFEEVEKITKEAPVETSARPPKEKKPVAGDQTVITAYVSVGLTAAVPTLEELEFYESSLYERDVNPLAFGGGIQVLFPVKQFKLGFDVGVKKTFTSTASYDMDLIFSTGYSEQVDKESAINILFVGEFNPSDAFFVQGGLGTYMNSWFYSYEYYNPDYASSYTYDEYSGTHWNFGLLLAGGTAFQLTDNIAIPLYLRADIMFRYGIMIPITANSGVRISF
jgi:opacity protein-like surface antigen